MIIASILMLLGALTLEGTFFALPIVLVLLLVLQIAYRSYWVLLAAFLAGLFLDILLFRTIGVSSMFFLLMLGLIGVYERRFEVRSYPFLFSIVLLGSSVYLVTFGSTSFLMQLVASEVIGTILFLFFVGFKLQHELR